MDVLPDSFVERLQKANRCKPEVFQIAQEISVLAPSDYDTLAARLTESGEDHALGILMDAAAINKIKFNPVVLANALRVVKIIIDIKYPYNYQDQSAIEPLLAVALAEDLSHERHAFAARLAVELTMKFGYPMQPVKKVLWKLMEDIRSEEASLMLDASLAMLEENGRKNVFSRLLGGDVLSELPAERPPVVIGDGGTVRRPVEKIGRNEPCRCGSGKKYKKCCYSKDQIIMRDASAYEGVTMSQLRENPSVVNDTAPIRELRPYELKKLVPSKLNDDQLIIAYRRADTFGMREFALQMLLELKCRPGKEKSAIEHMADFLDSALRAQDIDIVRKLAPHIPEEERYFFQTDKLKHELLENTDKFRDLEALCRKDFVRNEDNKDHWLLELSCAFEDILPALCIVFGRAAIVSRPEMELDNEMLIDAIHKSRIALDLEPWGDPIEDYWDWKIGKDSDHVADKDKDAEIRKLQKQLLEARGKSTLALKDLQEKEKELAGLEKKLQNVNPVVPAGRRDRPAAREAEQNGLTVEMTEEERKREITALKKKIDVLKDEIGNQQESKRQLRRELQAANEKIAKQNSQKTMLTEVDDKEVGYPVSITEKVRVPEFTNSFRESCAELPPDLVIKAMQSAVGFASRDNVILRQTVPIERMPGHYRIRIGIHHRLIVRRTPKNELQILEMIPRKDLETWIRQHAP